MGVYEVIREGRFMMRMQWRWEMSIMMSVIKKQDMSRMAQWERVMCELIREGRVMMMSVSREGSRAVERMTVNVMMGNNRRMIK